MSAPKSLSCAVEMTVTLSKSPDSQRLKVENFMSAFARMQTASQDVHQILDSWSKEEDLSSSLLKLFEITAVVAEYDFSKAPTRYEYFDIPVNSLGFSSRTSNCLKADNLLYVGDLVKRSEGDLLKIPNFGRRALNEVKEALIARHLRLGMGAGDWKPKA